MTRISDFINANPPWPWPWPWLRNTNITDAEREIFERYGETVISMQVRGSFVEDVEHAREWLKERARSRQRRETITFILEFTVVLLILGEILLALRQEHLQSLNFKQQQQTQTKNFNEQLQALTTLQKSSQTTADNLTSLHAAIESTNTILQMQLNALKKSAAESARSAKAGEASASTASQALHVSERAYVRVDAGVTSIPKAGEKLGFQAYFENSGRTPALDVITGARSGIALSSETAEQARSRAFGQSLPIPYTSKGIIPAGGRVQASWQSVAPLSQAELDGLTTHRMTFYVFADVTYKDEFNLPHKTRFCAFLDPATNTLLRCDSLNDAN